MQPALSGDMGDNYLSLMRREINISSYAIIKEIMGNAVVDHLPLRVRCECAGPLCEAIINVSLSRRRELRLSFPTGFIISPSHSGTDQSNTIRKTDEYAVVQKARFSKQVTDI
jgi:hypothetical protein